VRRKNQVLAKGQKGRRETKGRTEFAAVCVKWTEVRVRTRSGFKGGHGGKKKRSE